MYLYLCVCVCARSPKLPRCAPPSRLPLLSSCVARYSRWKPGLLAWRLRSRPRDRSPLAYDATCCACGCVRPPYASLPSTPAFSLLLPLARTPSAPVLISRFLSVHCTPQAWCVTHVPICIVVPICKSSSALARPSTVETTRFRTNRSIAANAHTTVTTPAHHRCSRTTSRVKQGRATSDALHFFSRPTTCMRP